MTTKIVLSQITAPGTVPGQLLATQQSGNVIIVVASEDVDGFLLAGM
jgi:hypothetical protein